MFTAEDGQPLRPETVSQAFRRRVTETDLPVIRLHDLRHTWASLALLAGVPAKIVSERLGHSTVSFTLDTYSHVLPGLQADAANRVPSSSRVVRRRRENRSLSGTDSQGRKPLTWAFDVGPGGIEPPTEGL